MRSFERIGNGERGRGADEADGENERQPPPIRRQVVEGPAELRVRTAHCTRTRAICGLTVAVYGGPAGSSRKRRRRSPTSRYFGRREAPFPAGRGKSSTSPYGRPPACRIRHRRGCAGPVRWTCRQKFASTMTQRTSRGSVDQTAGRRQASPGLNVDTLDGPKWFWVGSRSALRARSGYRLPAGCRLLAATSSLPARAGVRCPTGRGRTNRLVVWSAFISMVRRYLNVEAS